eukprot:TRINITY_DN71015_c2_g1_i1.p1 TRINITY_DN71015_c2_g1~~TRINITY_DN71015_c2_g1_i1.p1  ORF type:complete len:1027 (-),score=106.69 TRINITY_DN71015_c2_g1_i1:12447-15527(-)
MGSSLYLPFTDELVPTIELSLIIYKKWLGISGAGNAKVVVPDCLKEERQQFYQDIIKQLSVIFEKRTNPKSATDKYYNYCKEVLRIYGCIASELCGLLSETTWDTLLRVNIGIANKFLSEPKSLTDPSEQLTQLLIDHVFDLWLRSGVQQPKLFACLSNYASGWIHRENVIQAWARVCKSLTKRLTRVLYNVPYFMSARLLKPPAVTLDLHKAFAKEQGKYVIVFPHETKEPSSAKVYNLSNEQLIYFWLRFLFLFDRRLACEGADTLGNKRALPFNEPEGYQLYVKCLADILKEFANVGRIVKHSSRDAYYDANEIEKAVKTVIPPRFLQSQQFGEEFKELLCEIMEERKKALVPPGMPNGNIILKIFGVNFFEATHQTSGSFEYEKSAYAELCKLFANFPGPFSYVYPAWFYFRLKTFLVRHKFHLGAHNILMNSSKLFLSDLHGSRLLAPLFAEYVKEVLSKPGSVGTNKVTRVCFKILSQLISLPSNFAATELKVLKEEKSSLALSQLNRYLEMQKSITGFLDLEAQEKRFSGDTLCALLWIGALDTLENKQPKEYLDYVICIINRCFYERFDTDIFDPKKVASITVVLDILEVLVTGIGNQIDSGINHQLNVIACQLIVFADDKIPLEGTALLKRVQTAKNYGYEKVVCRMIQLCLLISNTSPNFENDALISCLKSIIVKTKKAAMNEKVARYFGYAYLESVAKFALDFLSLHSQKHRVSTYMPNLDSVFCNKYPKEPATILYGSSCPKTHFMLLNESRVVTISELHTKYGLYDLLVVVRDQFGHFAYRAQLMCNIRQLAEILSESGADSSGSSSPKCRPEKPDEEREKQELITNRAIHEINMPTEELETQNQIEELLKAEWDKEKEILQKKTGVTDIIETEHEKNQVNTSENTLARLFFKHFQFIQGRHISSACILQETSEFMHDLKAIDSKAIRATHTIPILYYKSSTSTQYEANYGDDPCFNEILGELGVVLETKHIRTGNFGHFKDLIEDVGVVYYAGLFYEQVFIAPSIRLNNKPV